MAVTTGTGPTVPHSRMKHPNNLRKLRIAAGIPKQAHLAERLADKSITKWSVTTWERGQKPIPDQIAPKLAEILNTTIPALTQGRARSPRTTAHSAKKRYADAARAGWAKRRADKAARTQATHSNGHDPHTITVPVTMANAPGWMQGTPTMVMLFAAAASLPPNLWPMAIRVLHAMAQTERDNA